VSPPGNLYATLLLADPAPPECAAQSSFVAALAVHDAIIDCAPALRDVLKLKWPNDVLCGGSKLAGILIEAEQAAHGLAVAIGIGVNIRHHPDGTAYPVTDISASGAEVSAESLFAALSAAMVERLTQWRRGTAFGAIRTEWLERAAFKGGEMKVRLPGGELSGRYESLDDRGCLMLRLSDGTLQAIAGGEVFPVAAAAARIE
jgi:BirA family transcriptional regulator, biotin operon repressor / biotin---[acetyl-CoA-carboxylase] ligase